MDPLVDDEVSVDKGGGNTRDAEFTGDRPRIIKNETPSDVSEEVKQ